MNNSALEMGCQCVECERRLVLKFEISMSAVGGRRKRKEPGTVVLGVLCGRSLRSLRSKISLR
jgi:hypothetical protein